MRVRHLPDEAIHRDRRLYADQLRLWAWSLRNWITTLVSLVRDERKGRLVILRATPGESRNVPIRSVVEVDLQAAAKAALEDDVVWWVVTCPNSAQLLSLLPFPLLVTLDRA